ncbi:hypothetical protein [Agarivorans sp. DSG3-1]|uniref:hypothetical protein n=1 Tax=Agarivorans sp. DSG3-1 TaxID=3342249 RepID=UPI00398E770A
MKFWKLLSVVSVLSLAACGGGGSDGGGGNSDVEESTILSSQYLPAQIGAVWRYSDVNTGQIHQLSSSSVASSSNNTERFTLNWEHSGFKQSFNHSQGELFIESLQVEQLVIDGKNYKLNFNLSDNPMLLLPEFAPEGKRPDLGYKDLGVTISPSIGATYGDYLQEWEYHGIDTVVTASGNYEALHISYWLALNVSVDVDDLGVTVSEQIHLEQELWFSPSIGIVKLVDRSESATQPLELSFISFNKYLDDAGNASELPVNISIDQESPWRNLNAAYGLDQYYGTWGNQSYTCNPDLSSTSIYELTVAEELLTLRTTTYDSLYCINAGTDIHKTESIKSGTYRFIDNGEASSSISLVLNVENHLYRALNGSGEWGEYEEMRTGGGEMLTLEKLDNSRINLGVYEAETLYLNELNFIAP